MVKLLSHVLEEEAPNPRTLHPEIPKVLARVIHRCLAKTPTDRFKSYADLTKALQPYISESPTPGHPRPPLRRLHDRVSSSSGPPGAGLGEIINPDNIATPKYFTIIISLNVIMMIYFCLSDGLRGTTAGKKLATTPRHRPGRSATGHHPCLPPHHGDHSRHFASFLGRLAQ